MSAPCPVELSWRHSSTGFVEDDVAQTDVMASIPLTEKLLANGQTMDSISYFAGPRNTATTKQKDDHEKKGHPVVGAREQKKGTHKGTTASL